MEWNYGCVQKNKKFSRLAEVLARSFMLYWQEWSCVWTDDTFNTTKTTSASVTIQQGDTDMFIAPHTHTCTSVTSLWDSVRCSPHRQTDHPQCNFPALSVIADRAASRRCPCSQRGRWPLSTQARKSLSYRIYAAELTTDNWPEVLYISLQVVLGHTSLLPLPVLSYNK